MTSIVTFVLYQQHTVHHKNPFIEEYDFDTLVRHHEELGEHVFVNTYGNKSIRFGDRNAVKALNAALLKYHYGIKWDIPENYLCPPVPGRLDYLLHIADLLPAKDIHILDIGTGANLIYPILASCHFNWKCTTSEVDPVALKNAREIITKNEKLSGIELRQQLFKKSILNNIIKPDDFFDAVVCNPPFYKSKTDAHKKNIRKVKNLKLTEEENRNFAGRSSELWYKGGEVAFIKKMVEESTQFKSQVHWFTSLVSDKDHIKSIKRIINKTEPAEVKIVEMELGNKKSRFVAWRF